MKLLFDQNLSSKLVPQLADLFPHSEHVKDLALDRAEDDVVWNYARDHGFVLVSKDADFRQRSFLYGFPPKVLWVTLGNCSSTEIEKAIRKNNLRIIAFVQDGQASFFALEETRKNH